MVSQTVEYALRAMSHLASLRGVAATCVMAPRGGGVGMRTARRTSLTRSSAGPCVPGPPHRGIIRDAGRPRIDVRRLRADHFFSPIGMSWPSLPCISSCMPLRMPLLL